MDTSANVREAVKNELETIRSKVRFAATTNDILIPKLFTISFLTNVSTYVPKL